MRSKPSPLETFPGCERRLNRKLVAVQSGANGIGFKTQKLLDLAIATDGLEARIEYEIGHDDLLIVNTKSGLTQRADNHTRKIDLARELSGYPRLFPQFSNRAASKRFAGESFRRCAIRELWEEAGVPRELAREIDFPGVIIRSLREATFGIHDQQVIVADLILDTSFEPVGRDGEVEEFLCLEADAVRAALDGDEFTVEAALATRECLERRGL